MSTGDGDNEPQAFDMSIEAAPKTAPVIDAEEDEEGKRERAAALASTFDPERAHAGKSEEELIAEREAETRELIDAAIVVGVVIAVAEANDNEAPDVEPDGFDASDGVDE